MKQKFLKDIGIDIEDETKDLLNQFDLNGYMDQIADNRIKEEAKLVEEQKKKIEEDDSKTKTKSEVKKEKSND